MFAFYNLNGKKKKGKIRKICLSGVNTTDYYIINANLYLDVLIQ